MSHAARLAFAEMEQAVADLAAPRGGEIDMVLGARRAPSAVDDIQRRRRRVCARSCAIAIIWRIVAD
ncbi:hypothetical protein [Paracoccus xiamenensis]|uniref:hypothetical protein n=1 Tax=Paracoccus xiamenensis TaxID=2714901 RepID=UPI00140D1CFE|nr:hypothetical protein [Paracoccus xiamenensis]NHF73834.1 hypothetical protein [Paracoccus xiamenensis]